MNYETGPALMEAVMKRYPCASGILSIFFHKGCLPLQRFLALHGLSKPERLQWQVIPVVTWMCMIKSSKGCAGVLDSGHDKRMDSEESLGVFDHVRQRFKLLDEDQELTSKLVIPLQLIVRKQAWVVL